MIRLLRSLVALLLLAAYLADRLPSVRGQLTVLPEASLKDIAAHRARAADAEQANLDRGLGRCECAA